MEIKNKVIQPLLLNSISLRTHGRIAHQNDLDSEENFRDWLRVVDEYIQDLEIQLDTIEAGLS